MPPKKRPGKAAGSAGATIPGVKALLRACLKSMSVVVERLSDQEDVTALRKAFDDALMRSSGLKRGIDVPGFPDWGDTASPVSDATGLEAMRELFASDCLSVQESVGSQFTNGVPNYETDPVLAEVMKKGVPMVEVRIVLLSLAAAVAKGGGAPALFRVQSPAEDFAVVIYVNRVCLWDAPDGPVPVLDAAYAYDDTRNVGTNPDHPSLKLLRQLVEHAHHVGAGHGTLETEFTTDGAKALALALERNASILGAKVCEGMKARWSLPPLAARRMHATVVLPVKVMGAEDAHKVERKGGRACANCVKPLPVTADVCSACRETFYCGPACQAANWPEHKKTCKKSHVSFDNAVEVQHGFNPFAHGGEDMVYQSVSTSGGRRNDGVRRDLNQAQKLPAMPSSGFIVKVQVGLEQPEMTPMVVYPRGKRFETFIPPSAPCHRVLFPVVRNRGVCSGQKLYMWASRQSDDTFLINVDDFPDQDQAW